MNAKRIIAALLAAMLLLCCAACGAEEEEAEPVVIDDPCYARVGEKEIPASVYQLFLLEGFNSVANAYELDYKKVLKADVDGVSGEEFVNNYADDMFARYYAVEKEYADKGLETSNNDALSAAYSASYYYQSQGKLYEMINVPKEGLAARYLIDAKSKAIFYDRYGKGGELEIPQADKDAAMRDTYYRVQYLSLGKDKGTDSLSAKDIMQEYLDRYNAGEKLEDIIYSLEQEQNETQSQTEGSIFVQQATRAEDYEYDYYIPKTDSGYPEEMIAAIDGMADNAVELTETTDTVYLLRKLPVNGDRNPAWEETALNSFAEEKGEEFDAYLDSLAEVVEVDYADGMRSNYNAASFYKLLKKYIFEAQLEQLNG